MNEGKNFAMKSDTLKKFQLKICHVLTFLIETPSFEKARKVQSLSILEIEKNQNLIF